VLRASPTKVETGTLTVVEMREFGMPLLREHWQEIALNKKLMVLAPDWARYERLEAEHKLLALGTWDCSELTRKLIGYSVSFIGTHLHYSDLTCCMNDVLFVCPDMRASRIGFRLIHETERVAKLRGARMMLWHAKPATAFELLLPQLGYGVQDIMFSKEL